MELELERRLIERAAQGDMAAFEQLYRAHAPGLLHRVIRPRTASLPDAEDVLVDTFQTALTHLPGFRWTGKSLFAWLARIALNKCNDAGRRRGRESRGRETLEAEPPEVAAPGPEEILVLASDRAALREGVEAALRGINPRYADAIRLRLGEGRSREECAARLEVRIGTFDVLLLRAVRAFRKAWRDRDAEGRR